MNTLRGSYLNRWLTFIRGNEEKEEGEGKKGGSRGKKGEERRWGKEKKVLEREGKVEVVCCFCYEVTLLL